MTFLEIINGVLSRLREQTVTTNLETDYSILSGLLVNDAKNQVEQAHEWTALRKTIEFNTVVGTTTYSLTSAYQSAILKCAMNTGNKTYLRQQTKDWMNDRTVLNTAATGEPTSFAYMGTDANNYLQVQLYPTPDKIQTIKFDMVVPQADLSDDTTQLTIPSQPIIQLAFAMALRERGETGGISAQEQFAVAQRSLGDAIAIDANKYPEELVFYSV
jgi:hypothetical protein